MMAINLMEIHRPFDCDYDSVIERIERDEQIYRDEFRAGELAGTLAPHAFVENPTNAVCQDCDLVIQFLPYPPPPMCEICETAVATTRGKFLDVALCADCAESEPCPDCGEPLSEHDDMGKESEGK